MVCFVCLSQSRAYPSLCVCFNPERILLWIWELKYIKISTRHWLSYLDFVMTTLATQVSSRWFGCSFCCEVLFHYFMPLLWWFWWSFSFFHATDACLVMKFFISCHWADSSDEVLSFFHATDVTLLPLLLALIPLCYVVLFVVCCWDFKMCSLLLSFSEDIWRLWRCVGDTVL